MKWLTNTYNPYNPDAEVYFLPSENYTFYDYLTWLKDKILGEPKATEKYTSQQLKDMGYVGVYSKE